MRAYWLWGGLYFYQYKKVEKLNNEAEQKITRAPENFVNFALSRSNLNADQQKALLNMLVKLQGLLPKGEILGLQERVKELEAIKSVIPEQPKLEGFDQIGVESADLRPVFNNNFFPAGFLNGNISRIKFEDKTAGRGWAIVGAEMNFEEKVGNTFTYHRSSRAIFNQKDIGEDESRSSIWPITLHELGHANSWNTKLSLTPEQRVQFLFDVQDTFLRYRKYSTPLVDVASPDKNAELTMQERNHQDDKELFIIKLNEFWAELCAGYLEFPNVFAATASDQEKQLIQQWLIKGDSKFNNFKARNDRHNAWSLAKAKIYSKLVKNNMDADAGLRKK